MQETFAQQKKKVTLRLKAFYIDFSLHAFIME